MGNNTSERYIFKVLFILQKEKYILTGYWALGIVYLDQL